VTVCDILASRLFQLEHRIRDVAPVHNVMTVEHWSSGRVHRATIWASAFVVMLQQVRDPIGHSGPWQAFAARVQIHSRYFHI
jgi:hypothetical protein